MIVLFPSHTCESDRVFEFPESLTFVRYFASRGAEQLQGLLRRQTYCRLWVVPKANSTVRPLSALVHPPRGSNSALSRLKQWGNRTTLRPPRDGPESGPGANFRDGESTPNLFVKGQRLSHRAARNCSGVIPASLSIARRVPSAISRE